MENPDTKIFHKLIKMNQVDRLGSAVCFNVNGKTIFDEIVQTETVKYCYDNLTVPKDEFGLSAERLKRYRVRSL